MRCSSALSFGIARSSWYWRVGNFPQRLKQSPSGFPKRSARSLQEFFNAAQMLEQFLPRLCTVDRVALGWQAALLLQVYQGWCGLSFGGRSITGHQNIQKSPKPNSRISKVISGSAVKIRWINCCLIVRHGRSPL